METNSKMRTSNQNTLDLVFFPWLMLDPTLMALSSSYVLSKLDGWMVNTLFLEALPKVWISYQRSNLLVPKAVKPRRKLLLPIVVNLILKKIVVVFLMCNLVDSKDI